MAKDNMLLGMARGKVGDVVFYRANGEQISRARNRAPRNPKTNAQQISRAIAATVQQAYAAGKRIFDHSFQDKAVPAGSQREFLSVNMRQLRQDYAADIAAGTTAANCLATFVGPKATRPVPYCFTVSGGKLDMKIWNIVAGDGTNDVAVQMVQAASGTVGEWATANHVVPNDIYTIVAFGSFSGIAAYDSAPATGFGFIRLKVKSDIMVNVTAWDSATLADLFNIDESGGSTAIPGSTLVSAKINIDQVVSSCLTGAIGVIRSRENSGERSECRLMARPALDSAPYAPWVGIKSPSLLDKWSADATRLGDSDLILEGGNF